MDVGDVIDAVPLLAKTCVLMFFCFNFSANIRFFVNVLIEMNVNRIDEMNVNRIDELNFSDVYQSVNCIWSLAKFT